MIHTKSLCFDENKNNQWSHNLRFDENKNNMNDLFVLLNWVTLVTLVCFDFGPPTTYVAHICLGVFRILRIFICRFGFRHHSK